MENKIKKIGFFMLPLLTVGSLLGCSNVDDFVIDKSVKVVVESGEHYSLETNSYKVNKKSDLSIKMNIDEGYYVESLNYEDFSIIEEDFGATILLKDLRYSLRLKPQIGKYPIVHLLKDENYVADKYEYTVKDCNELDFNINVNKFKELESCSYSDYDALNLNENNINVRLFNIYSDVEVSFTFVDKQQPEPPLDVEDEDAKHMYSLMPKGNKATRYIFYCLNEGILVSDENEKYGFYKKVDMTHHLRPNTDIGTNVMKRDGYQLECWNTKRDGSGIRIGLGSRFTLDYSNIVLYAQWKQETDPSCFTYEKVNDQVVINKFVSKENNVQEIVIPNYLDNLKVTKINSDAFKNLNIGSLYMPLYLNTIKKGCFNTCSINELHFYDTTILEDENFLSTSIRKVYINAVERPRYCEDEVSYFPDDMDRLILNKDNKKMILYGGCSFSYGIISSELESAFPEYVICNMGVIGGTNSGFQMDCISHYVKDGDFLIHAPEPMSREQLMDTNKAEVRMFNNLESNYDLLLLVNITKIPGLFNAYHDFSIARKELEPCKYEDYCNHYNEYGDIKYDLVNEVEGKTYHRDEYGEPWHAFYLSDSNKYQYNFVDQESINLLEDYYGLFIDKGVDVVFSFAPVNKDSLNKSELNNQSWLKFEAKIKTYLTYPIISSVEDYLLPSEYFFNTDYHLNKFGAYLRTFRLIDDIKEYWSQSK